MKNNIFYIITFTLVFILIWYGMVVLASESGEVVTIYTIDSSNREKITRLWIVEHQGYQYIRSGNLKSGWTQRLVENPHIGMVRNNSRLSYKAELARNERAVINKLMEKKYGWADKLISFFFSRDDAVPIRLTPVSS